MHSPSEHTFDGKHYDLELHMVHQIIDLDPSKNEYAVVAIFFDSNVNGGRSNPFIDALNVKTIRSRNPYTVDEIPLMSLTQQISTQ